MKIHRRWLLPCAAVILALTVSKVKAAPYASCITNNNGNIQFYLNENGANVTVTFEDGTTNNIFTDVNAGTNVVGVNLLSKPYSFSMTGHSSYAIAVTKMGTGAPGVMPNISATNTITVGSTFTNLFVVGSPRGLAVNINQTSPYFGRIYVSRGYNGTAAFYDFNSDGSYSSAGANGSAAGYANWQNAGTPYSSPDRISIASNDDLVVVDYSVANAGVWLIDPNLVTNQLLLGPVGSANGIAAGIHGNLPSTPLLLGDLNSGANLYVVNGDMPGVLTNSICVYSNITETALTGGTGWQTAPSLIGPQVALPGNASTPNNGIYLFPSWSQGPSGYFYSGEYRSGTNTGLGSGDPAGVQVYSSTLHQLWNSRYNSGKSDYFCTSATGPANTQELPSDVAVSPDGKYLAAVAPDNHMTICLLTNGIPDVSTISIIRPKNVSSGEYNDGADEVKWDLADNLYVLGAGSFGLTTYTLGQSATCTTYGNLTGTTNFSTLSLNPTVNVYATNPPVISQINSHGNPTNGTFTIVRGGGNLGTPLTVSFGYSGTATNGTYTTGSPAGSIVFAANQTTTNINIAAVSDSTPRLTIYLTLTLNNSANYAVGINTATISILNSVTPELIPSAGTGASSMYNAFSNDYVSVVLTRLGDTNTTQTIAASGLTLTGSAVMGTDYTTPTTVTFNPGDLTQTIYMNPLVGGQLPTHNPNLTYTGNKTVTVKVANGSGYTGGSGSVTLNIIDSAYPAAQVLYFNPLTNAMDATNWNMTAADDYMSQYPTPDVDAQFGDPLDTEPSFYNGYTFLPVPPPPNGASNALMMTVNKASGVGASGGQGTAVNYYMTNQVFGGNYAVRFNMNVIEGDCTPVEAGSANPEEFVLFGINHNGTQTNLFFPAFGLGETYTNFAADGVFYAISDSGGRYDNIYQPYQGFIGHGSPATNTGWASTATKATSSFATQFKSSLFSCYASSAIAPNFNSGWTEGGPGLPVNGPQVTETAQTFSQSSWADVEIKQMGNVDSLWIDKTLIMSYTNNTGLFTNGYVMLGYEDPYDGGETPDTAAYYSNLRVVALTPPALIGAGAYNSPTNKFTFDFTSSDGDLTPSNFTVTGATNILNGFTAVSGATITQLNTLGIAAFQATVPTNGAIHFYRIVQH